jgi:hypothetical protein
MQALSDPRGAGIDEIVYHLFDLTPADINRLES